MRRTFAVAVLLVLAACTSPKDIKPAFTASPRAPMQFAVEQISVENVNEIATTASFKDRRRSDKLASDTRSFLSKRILADGGSGWLRVVINKATVIETPLEVEEGLTGIFTQEPIAQITGVLKVTLAIMDETGLEQGSGTAEVERRRQILENTSVLGYDKAVEEVIEGLLQQLDDSLTKLVDENLSDFLAF